METVAGIDVGTQSTKVVIYDPQARTVKAGAVAPHELISEEDGTREQKAEWWVSALQACLQQIDLGVRRTVSAIGVSGQQHGFVPLDEAGNVLYNVKLWCDTSTADECREITQSFGGADKLLAEVGNLILPGYTAPKILWLKKRHPDLYHRMSRILLPHDYINFFLTGRTAMEYGDASGTGLLDIRSRTWSEPLLQALDPHRKLMECLPEFVEPDQPVGFLRAPAAEFLGLPEGILVSAGGGDNMMGAVGTGCTREGMLTVSLGTSGTLYGYSADPVIDPEGHLAAFCSSTGGWLPLLCTMNCTVATELMRLLLQLGLDEANRLAAQSPPGSEGVILLPFFNGERTPNLPHGKGCLVGLNPANTTRRNIVRASMEAAVLGLKMGLESFEKVGFQAREVRLIGGGAKSSTWRQIVADILNLPVVTPLQEEAAAFGAALQALHVVQKFRGNTATINDIVEAHVATDLENRQVPEPGTVARYRTVYAAYCAYVAALAPLFT